MKKITDIFAEKERTFSFEFFPPKTQTGMDKLYDVAEAFKLLNPTGIR
jgi:5,10-methylenetetrahydrofolate reductase